MTAREYAQTLELLDAARDRRTTVVGPRHGGARAAGKARAMARSAARAAALRARPHVRRRARARLARAADDVARSLGIPSSYAFDYEFARAQHGLGCRAATRVVVPEAIPQERLDRLGARAPKVRRYPGLKEEYYLHGFEPDPSRARRARGRSRRACSSSCARRPRCRSTTATATRSSRTCSSGSAATRAVHAVVLPRTDEQRRRDRATLRCRRSSCPSTRSTRRASSRSPTSSSRPAGR